MNFKQRLMLTYMKAAHLHLVKALALIRPIYDAYPKGAPFHIYEFYQMADATKKCAERLLEEVE